MTASVEYVKTLIETLREIVEDNANAREIRSAINRFTVQLEDSIINAEPVKEPLAIDEGKEAQFIQDQLLKQGIGVISIEDIIAVTAAQTEYLISMGIVE